MFRLVLFLIGVVALAAGLSWLAEQPGSVQLNFGDYEIQTSLFRAVVMMALVLGFGGFAWSVLRQIWNTPASVGEFINRRRQARGLDALSSGMIAIGAGDKKLALRYAGDARKSLPNEPLTHLLRAQAAQLSGDRATSRRIFEAMLGSPDTEQLGLRGLFLEAQREGEQEAAGQFAARALELNPKLTWPFESLFELQCKSSDWAGALKSLATGYKNGHLEKADADRRRAVLLTAQAQAIEEEDSQKALDLAVEAHNLAPDLVPAAAIAGRQLAARGSTPRAAKIIERTWKKSPHPDLSVVYAFARPGDSPRDRLERIKRLARTTPHSSEGPIAVAAAAVDARNWDEARSALAPLLENRLSPRVCTLMARIEGGERQNSGGVREWLARALTAPRDPAWTANGMVSDSWAPISPVTGALDAFQWKVPLEAAPGTELPAALDQLAEFAGLGQRIEGQRGDGAPMIAAIGAADAMAGASRSGGVPKRDASNVVDIVPPGPGEMPSSGAASPMRAAVVQAATANAALPHAVASGSPAARSESSISVEIVEKAKPVAQTPVLQTAPTTGSATVTLAPAVPLIVKAKQAPPVAIKPGIETGAATNGAKPFVSPRAPDDPGLDEREDIVTPRADYVAKVPKRTH